MHTRLSALASIILGDGYRFSHVQRIMLYKSPGFCKQHTFSLFYPMFLLLPLTLLRLLSVCLSGPAEILGLVLCFLLIVRAAESFIIGVFLYFCIAFCKLLYVFTFTFTFHRLETYFCNASLQIYTTISRKLVRTIVVYPG